MAKATVAELVTTMITGETIRRTSSKFSTSRSTMSAECAST